MNSIFYNTSLSIRVDINEEEYARALFLIGKYKNDFRNSTSHSPEVIDEYELFLEHIKNEVFVNLKDSESVSTSIEHISSSSEALVKKTFDLPLVAKGLEIKIGSVEDYFQKGLLVLAHKPGFKSEEQAAIENMMNQQIDWESLLNDGNKTLLTEYKLAFCQCFKDNSICIEKLHEELNIILDPIKILESTNVSKKQILSYAERNTEYQRTIITPLAFELTPDAEEKRRIANTILEVIIYKFYISNRQIKKGVGNCIILARDESEKKIFQDALSEIMSWFSIKYSADKPEYLFLQKRGTGQSVDLSLKELRERNFVESIRSRNTFYLDLLKRISKHLDNYKTPIMLLGETGAGKSYLAYKIHRYSTRSSYFKDPNRASSFECESKNERKDAKFFQINLAEFSEKLIEGELFGFEKGAHSQADKLKKGLIEIAHGGTLFIDEIGDAPLSVQTKLLLYLDNNRFRRMGGTVEISTDVRLIFATNKNLKELVITNKMRADFFHRISGFTFTLPPLKERNEDLLHFINHTIKNYSEEINYPPPSIDQDAISYILKGRWTGNYREVSTFLKNCIEDCRYKNRTSLSIQTVKMYFPENGLTEDPIMTDLMALEKILLKYMEVWVNCLGTLDLKVFADKNGLLKISNATSFLKAFVEPIIAKIFFESGLSNRLNKKRASVIIGMENEHGIKSKIAKSCSKYGQIPKLINTYSQRSLNEFLKYRLYQNEDEL